MSDKHYVWVVTGCYDYEPTTTLAVYDNQEDAERIKAEWNAKSTDDKYFEDVEVECFELGQLNRRGLFYE